MSMRTTIKLKLSSSSSLLFLSPSLGGIPILGDRNRYNKAYPDFLHHICGILCSLQGQSFVIRNVKFVQLL